MKHVLAIIEYDGTKFLGFQIQKNKRTVESVIKKVLTKLSGNKSDTINKKLFNYSSRLDSGVHSKGVVIDFFYNGKWSLPEFKDKLNKLLPEDIKVKKITYLKKNFNSRYSIKLKKYVYTISIIEKSSPFISRYVWWIKRDLDVLKMEQAARCLIGKKDFKSFISTGSDRKNSITTITSIKFIRNRNILKIEFIGKNFFYKMIRNIVGFLCDIGRGLYHINDVNNILKGNQKFTKFTAPAKGLTFEKAILK